MAIEKISIEISSNAKDVEKELKSLDSAIKNLQSKRTGTISISSNAKDIEKQISDIDAQLKKLQASKAAIEVDAGILSIAKERINEINIEMKKLQAQKIAIQVNSTDTETAKKQIDEIKSKMDQLRSEKANLQVTTAELKGADKELNSIQKQMDSLDNKKARLQVEQEEISQSQTGIEKLGSKLKEIGNTKTSINISSNIEKVGSQLSSFGSKLLSLANPVSSLVGQFIGLSAAMNLVNSAISLVTDSIDGAVSRYDTLNNFPKIMANFKVSAEDSEIAINKLTEGLNGLPTTLDSAVTSLQRFVTKNNDIEKSTDYVLALNNALLAGAKSETDQASALEQLQQAYSKGKMDQVEWLSLQNAMAGQLNQVAIAMGTTSDALGEGLKDGSISMDDFMDTIVRLNTEGVDGFASFEQQAFDAIGGIATGIKRMGTAVERGNTAILTSLENLANLSGFDGIAGVLGGIGSAFETGLGRIAELITENEDKIAGFIENVKSFDWAGVWNGFKEGVKSLKDSAVVEFLTLLAKGAKELVTVLGGGDFATGLGKLVPTLIKVGASAKVLGTVLQGLGKFTNLKLPSFGKKSDGSSGLSFNFDVGNAVNQVKNVALIYATVKIIQELAQAMQDINEKVPSDLSKLAPKLLNMGIALTAMGVFVGIAGALTKSNTAAAISGVAVVAALAGELMLAAEAMQQISEKVPTNVANFATKIGNMSIALGAIGVLAGVAGGLASLNLVAAAAGIVAIAGISVDLMLAAEAMQQINEKVPDDISNFASKIANISIAIGAMEVLSLASGAIALIAWPAVLAGLANIVVVCGELVLAAEAIQTVNEKVPDDIASVENKIKNIETAITAFNDAELGSLLDLLENVIGSLNIGVITNAVNKMVELVDELNRFASDEIQVPENISEKIDQIEEVINSFDGTGLIKLIKDTFEALDISVLNTALEQMVEMVELINQIAKQKIDDTKALENIGKIQSVMDNMSNSEEGIFTKLKDLVSSAIDTASFNEANKAFTQMVEIAKSLKKLEGNAAKFNKDAVLTIVGNINEVITELDGGTIGRLISAMAKKAELDKVKESIETLIEINQVISDLVGATSSSTSGIFAGLPAGLAGSNVFTNATTTIRNITSVIEALGDGTIGKWIGSIVKTEELENVKESLTTLISITEEIKPLAEDAFTEEAKTAVTDTIGRIKTVIDAMNNFPDVDGIDGVSELVQSFINLASELKSLDGQFNDIGENYGSSIITGFESADVPGKVISVIEDVLTKLKNKTSKFKDIGKEYGNALKNAFATAIKGMASKMDSQITALKAYSAQFTNMGTLFGQSLATSFKTAISSMSTEVIRQVALMRNALSTVTIAGVSALSYSSGTSASYYADGGQVGVDTFRARGTDTVPAMLTRGEYVQSKAAVDAYGTEFMNRINNLDLIGAFRSLTGNFGLQNTVVNQVYNTVNNVSNDNRTTKANISQTINSGNPSYSLRRAKRWL